MENSTQSSTKRIQVVITGVLALILLGLVAGYVYYGMRLAKQSDSVTDIDTQTPAEQDAPPTLTREEKLQILESLSKDSSTTTVTAEEKKAAMDNLTKDAPPSTMSEDEKRAILQQLQAPQ